MMQTVGQLILYWKEEKRKVVMSWSVLFIMVEKDLF